MSNAINGTPNRTLVDDTKTRASERVQDDIAADPQAHGTQQATTRATQLAAQHVVDRVSTETTHPSASTIHERIADLGAAPTLPSTASSVRAELPTSASLSDFMSRTADGTGALMWNALMTMARDSSNDTKDAADARNAFQQGKVTAKQGQIKAQERENAAGRDDAGMQLGFATAGAVISIAAANTRDPTTGEMKPVAQAIAQATPGLTQALGQYISKTAGPQARANKAKLENMHQQVAEELANQAVENAKSAYDEAREQMKLAVKILTEHSERQTQISTTITRV